MVYRTLTILALTLISAAEAAPTTTISVDIGHPGIAVSPMFNGMMTEEINHAFDGGLYAELIQNRSFLDDAHQPTHWKLIGDVGGADMALDTSSPMNAGHPVSLRVDFKDRKSVGLANEGFWGIPAKPNTKYQASFYAKGDGRWSGPITVAIKSNDGQTTFAEGKTDSIGGAWRKYTVELQTQADVRPSSNNQFVLSFPTDASGSIFLTMVSLFPPTYGDRANGLRPDLMELMKALRPTFLRLPGGNYLEGNDFAGRFDWKKMIGPVDERAGHMGCWSYRSSDGFGLPEFLTWCEQLNMEPLLGVFAGYTLQGDHVVAGPALQPYVDEALQEIEYCTGSPDSEWGKRRAADGHPAPFKIHYVEVGNEDQFDRARTYEGRFAQFFDAIKAKYPEMQIIATIPVKSRRPDMIDDHYYRSPKQMAYDNHHYDKADRSGAKIFVGEWASQDGRPTPNLRAALGDAAWLMGLERDSDLVKMQAYAPLLINVNDGAGQWGTNLIGYDALHAFGSASYWAQVMLAQNQGDRVLPTQLKTNETFVSPVELHGRVGLGTYRTAAEYSDLSITDLSGKPLLPSEQIQDIKNWRTEGGEWKIQSGVVTQSSDQIVNPTATIGDAGWGDYKLHVKAKKLSGSEGFLIVFRDADRGNLVWWNIGGSNNTISSFEVTNDGSRQYMGPSSPYTVSMGRTYDLALEIAGTHFKGYIDGQLEIENDFKPVATSAPIFADSTYLSASGEVILKMVNASGSPMDADIHLDGAKTLDHAAKAMTLSSGSPQDENTIDQPEKVAPRTVDFKGITPSFRYSLPAYSLTLLRFSATP